MSDARCVKCYMPLEDDRAVKLSDNYFACPKCVTGYIEFLLEELRALEVKVKLMAVALKVAMVDSAEVEESTDSSPN